MAAAGRHEERIRGELKPADSHLTEQIHHDEDHAVLDGHHHSDGADAARGAGSARPGSQ